MNESDAQTPEPEAQPAARGRATIKRRWAVIRNASGGVALIAVAGAIAFGDPADQIDQSGDPGSDTEISAEH